VLLLPPLAGGSRSAFDIAQVGHVQSLDLIEISNIPPLRHKPAYSLAKRLLSSLGALTAPTADNASPPCIQKLLRPVMAIHPRQPCSLPLLSDLVVEEGLTGSDSPCGLP
jgi:hypothetical protein